MAACAEASPGGSGGWRQGRLDRRRDADAAAAAEACVGCLHQRWSACVGIECLCRRRGVRRLSVQAIAHARRLTVGGRDADLGPITVTAQIDVIRRHIEDALARGARAVVGGPEAVRPPYVHPTVLVEVPTDALVMREETFGPVLSVTAVSGVEEALRLANDSPYGLGGAVYGRRRALATARRLRSGMTAVNDVLSFAGMSSLPWGGVGGSGIERLRRRRSTPIRSRKSIVVRQARSRCPDLRPHAPGHPAARAPYR